MKKILPFIGVFLLLSVSPARLSAQSADDLQKQYDILIKAQVQTAVSMLGELYKKVERKEISPDEARRLGTALLRELRYGDRREGYFWADTVDGTNIVLYGNKEVEGKNRYEAEIYGIYYIKETIRNGLKPGGGFSEYYFPKQGEKKPLKKRSFSLFFEPFGWVVGTGYYVGDLEALVASTRREWRKGVAGIADQVREQVSAAFAAIDADLAAAAQKIKVSGTHAALVRNQLGGLCRVHPYAIDCAFVDLRGRMTIVEPEKFKSYEGSDISGQKQVIELHRNWNPVFSSVFRSVEGIYAMDCAYPVISGTNKLLGSISMLVLPEEMLAHIISPLVRNTPYEVWVMEKNGRLLYDYQMAGIGKNILKSKTYKTSPQLVALAERITAEESGSGSYEITERLLQKKVTKNAVWETVKMHGAAWRIVAVETAPGETIKE